LTDIEIGRGRELNSITGEYIGIETNLQNLVKD
jgi:hypothetical protein